MPRKSLILCVDDEWNGLEGRKMPLEEAACKVLVAASGAEALQLFASNAVDLVILALSHSCNEWGCRRSAHESWPIPCSNRSAVRR
jgi:CheY-like chemotaxis protein